MCSNGFGFFYDKSSCLNATLFMYTINVDYLFHHHWFAANKRIFSAYNNAMIQPHFFHSPFFVVCFILAMTCQLVIDVIKWLFLIWSIIISKYTQLILYVMISVNLLEFRLNFIIDLNFIVATNVLMNIGAICKQIKCIELLTVDIYDIISMNRSTYNFPTKLLQFFYFAFFTFCSLVPSNLIMSICVKSV